MIARWTHNPTIMMEGQFLALGTHGMVEYLSVIGWIVAYLIPYILAYDRVAL